MAVAGNGFSTLAISTLCDSFAFLVDFALFVLAIFCVALADNVAVPATVAFSIIVAYVCDALSHFVAIVWVPFVSATGPAADSGLLSTILRSSGLSSSCVRSGCWYAAVSASKAAGL